MRDDIRGRAFEFARKNADNWSADDIDNLASLLASERAAALGAAGDTIRSIDADLVGILRRPEVDAAAHQAIVLKRDGLADALDAIRSLSPDGWTAVRAEDLTVLKEAAQGALVIFEGSVTGVDDAEICTLRAALARLP